MKKAEIAEVAPKAQHLSTEELQEQATRSPKSTGHIEVKYITKNNGKTYGPYRYLRYWQNGVHKSVYLGKGTSSGYGGKEDEGAGAS